MIILDLDNVKLPRVNDRYNRNFSLKQSYSDGKDALIKDIAVMTRGKPKLKPPYYVIVDIGTHLDADSCIKPLFDAMQAAGVITNDKDIHEFTVSKTPVKRNQPNWIKVELYHLGEIA